MENQELTTEEALRELAKGLRKMRKLTGLTQQELARELDTTTQSIVRWESGRSLIAHPGMLFLAMGYLVLRRVHNGELIASEIIAEVRHHAK